MRQTFAIGAWVCVLLCVRARIGSADAAATPIRRSPSGAWVAEDHALRGQHYVLMRGAGACTARNVLVFFPGLGEARRGDEVARWGFWSDYSGDRALDALARGSLRSEDFGAWPVASRVADANQLLREKPYRDWAIVSLAIPPSPYRRAPFASVAARVDVALRDVARQCPRYDRLAEHTHIDGISLGGWLALEVAAMRPIFGFVGATQAAVTGRENVLTTSLRARGHIAALRILTSDRDPYRPMLERFSVRLQRAGVSNVFEVVLGPHSYAFNRGPGLLEILLWHHRVAR